MDRTFDIFEVLPDESPLWKACVLGAQNVVGVLSDIGKGTPNECFAMNMDTREILARVNVKRKTESVSESTEA
jgi:hypothetical protein